MKLFKWLVGFLVGLLFWTWQPVSLKAMTEQEEIEALKAQVQMLLKRIEELERRQAREEKAAESKAPANWKAYWKNGFRIEYKDPEKDREYKFRFRTGIQLRYTYMSRDEDFSGGDENYSSFNMRRLRFFVDGTAPNRDWKYYVHVQLEPKSSVNVHDAFVIWQRYAPFFKVQFGRMKIPAMSMEYWQSGFMQNGTDRTIFTDDSEGYWPYAGTPKLKVGGHLLSNGFPIGGMLLYRSQGINVNGALDLFGKKQFLAYWFGWYNGRDTQGNRNTASDDHLYSWRVAFNILPGSDPRGPLGPGTFNNYFMQGDYGYNTKPALALVLSGFWTKNRVGTYYTNTDTDAELESISRNHDVENYGFDAALLFRYKGFSADVEWAWEEFIQDPDKGNVGGHDEETWDRMGFRVNLGYFWVPRKWEMTFKYAYLERLTDDKLEDAIKSGVGLLKTKDGKYAIEDYMQQFMVGVNYYFHGFNQYITFDVSYLMIETAKPSVAEVAKMGLNGLSWDDETEEDWRFRVMYQYLF
ncbi:hypothetical protein [Thermosulfurimonas dismutans]|uniref:FmdC n=1 Tax=Thermosulfurimonas dismutans TaxID=999894 RepID=A0A179D743_9BACT|nr:hypothetical protein [Thermosulfurimonas dismutans]OAQ21428.1 FmdC precursor [Thermosulfurimonas dismutans]